MLLKRKNTLMEQLHSLAVTVNEAAQYFHHQKKDTSETREIFTDTIKAFEKKADGIIHGLIKDLNAHLITPFEREDILELALKLDDIIDGMESCVSHFYMFGLNEIDEVMSQFGENIAKNTSEILKSIELLADKKFPDIREFTIRINGLEAEADTLLRHGIRDLFQKSKDPIHIMRYKEMYEILEEVTDSCEDVADVLELIVMRNS